VSEDGDVAPNRRTGAILVAPPDAAWPDVASALLAERGYALARMNALSLIGFLMMSAGVAGMLVDACLLDTEAAVACVRAIARVQAQISVIVVGASAERETTRLAGVRLTAIVPGPPAKDDVVRWFPDLRSPSPGTGCR